MRGFVDRDARQDGGHTAGEHGLPEERDKGLWICCGHCTSWASRRPGGAEAATRPWRTLAPAQADRTAHPLGHLPSAGVVERERHAGIEIAGTRPYLDGVWPAGRPAVGAVGPPYVRAHAIVQELLNGHDVENHLTPLAQQLRDLPVVLAHGTKAAAGEPFVEVGNASRAPPGGVPHRDRLTLGSWRYRSAR